MLCHKRRPDPFDGLSDVSADQRWVDEQLHNWSLWLHTGSRTGATSPMWRFAGRPARGHDAYGSLTRGTVRERDASAVERSLPLLPRMHADVLRWAYLRRSSPYVACKNLDVPKWDLVGILIDARRRLDAALRAGQIIRNANRLDA